VTESKEPSRPFGRYATKEAADRAAASRQRSTRAKNLARARLIEAHRAEYEEFYATALAEIVREQSDQKADS
jgi:hypothetical protein